MATSVKDVLIRLRGVVSGAASITKMNTSLKNTATSLQRLSSATGTANKSTNRHNTALLGSVNAYKGLVGQVASMNKYMNVFGATIRQVGQGMQNLGTTVTAFISIPVGLVLRGWSNAVFAFDDSLISIRRNAGLTTESLDELRQGLVEMSKSTPTSLKDLAAIAEDVSKSGASDPSTILAFVGVIDQLSVATDLNSQQSSKGLLKIINLFHRAGEEASDLYDFAVKVGSAINSVGQNIVGSESEIISFLLRMAPAAVAAKIDIADLIGLAGTLVEISSSPEASGTRGARAITQMAVNSKELAKSLGLTTDEFISLNDNDPVAMFLSVVDAISKVESVTKRQILAQQLFGQIGAKTANALAAVSEEEGKLYENIAIANKAFSEGTSLQIEFELAMNSVSKQAALLKNNFNVIAITLGEAVLPALTQIITYAVPAVRILADTFAIMSNNTKLVAVGIGLLMIALGPLLFAFGSLLFSVGIITTGMSTLVVALLSVTALPLKLAGALLSILSPARLVIGAIVGITAALIAFQGDLGAAGAYISTFVSNMLIWGGNAATSFANGFASVSAKVAAVINGFLESIAIFFRSNSPPVAGPLKNIAKWGKNVAQSYVDAFAGAGMSPVLKFAGVIAASLESAVRGLSSSGLDIFGTISSLISSAAGAIGGDLGEKDGVLSSRVNSAVEAIAGAIKGMLNFGSVSGDTFDKIRASVGPFADDFIALIGHQKDYNKAVEDLTSIRTEQDSLNSVLQDEINAISARTDLTVAEKSALIRAARLKKNIRERELEEQEKAAQEAVKIAKDSADDQETIVRALISAINTANKGKKDEEDDLTLPVTGGPSAIRAEIASSESGLDSTIGNVNTFFDKLSEAEKKVRSFWAGLSGEDFDFENMGGDNAVENFAAFLAGENLKTSLDELREGFDEAKESITGFFDKIKELKSDGPLAILTPEQLESLEKAGTALAILGVAFAALKISPVFLESMVALDTAVGLLLGPVGLIAIGLGLLAIGLATLEPRWAPVATGVELVAFWIGKIQEAFTAGFLGSLDKMGVSADEVKDAWDELKAVLGPISDFLKDVLWVSVEGLVTILGFWGTALAAILGTALGFLAGVSIRLINALGDLWDSFNKLVEVEGVWGAIKVIFDDVVDDAKDWGKNLAEGFIGGITGFNPVTGIMAWLGEMNPYLESHSPPDKGPLSNIADWGKSVAESYIDAFSDADTEGVNDLANGMMSKLYGAIIEKVTDMGSNFESLGKTISGFIFDGMVEGIESAEKDLRVVVDTVSSWLKSKSANLITVGESISSFIMDGIVAEIAASEEQFDIISEVFEGWTRVFFSGNNAIVDAAKGVGSAVVDAISDGIKLGSSGIGLALASLINSISATEGSDLANSIKAIGGTLGKNIYTTIGTNLGSAESTTSLMSGLELAIRGIAPRYNGSSLDSAAQQIGALISGSVATGIRSTGFISEAAGGGRSGNRSAGGITVNFNGGVVVDSRSRVDELVEQISTGIGRNASSRSRIGGGRRG